MLKKLVATATLALLASCTATAPATAEEALHKFRFTEKISVGAPCGPGNFSELAAAKQGDLQVAHGQNTNGETPTDWEARLYVDPNDMSYTIVVHHTGKGVTCILMAGRNWEFYAPKTPNPTENPH